MSAVVLFAVGSPIVAEYEETCKRLGRDVAAAVRNRPGAVFASAAPIVDAGSLSPAQLAVPCLIPLFTPQNRAVAAREAAGYGFVFAEALVDPTAIVATSVRAGRGTYVGAGCIVGAHAVLGEHVLLNRGASVGHHVTVDAFASVGPGAVIAGNVTIGSGALVGAGAVLLPNVRIGAQAKVGAGAVVVGDVPEGVTVVGNPARPVTPSFARQ